MVALHSIMALLICLLILSLMPVSNVVARSSAVPTEGHCEEVRAVEGETATMTFTLRKDIDTTSPSFYAHLRRRANPMTDIILCDGPSIASKGCEVKKAFPMFQVTSHLKGNRLTVEISNMSRDLEDTYDLQTYYNNMAEPVISCTLNITDTLATTTPAIGTKGDGGLGGGAIAAIIIVLLIVILFIVVGVKFRNRIKQFYQDTIRASIQAHVTNTETERQDTTVRHDYEEYEPKSEDASPAGCDSPPPYSASQKGSSKERHPLLTKDSDGNGLPEGQRLLQEGKTSQEKPQDTGQEREQSAVPPTQAYESNPTKTMKTFPEKGERPANDAQKPGQTLEEQAVPPTKIYVPSPTRTIHAQPKKVDESHKTKRWYAANLNKDDVENRFRFRKNKGGSFLITPNQISPCRFTLTVLSKKEGTKQFTIYQNDDGFTLEGDSCKFDTLSLLVAHFQKKDIGKTGLRLNKPCEEEPNEEWYFGHLSQKEVDALFSSKTIGEGTFVLYDSLSDEDNYTLAVVSGGKPHLITVKPGDDGFIVSGKTDPFPTLQKLVEDYKGRKVTITGKVTAKLCTPCEKLLTDKEKEILERNGQGSYFIKPYPVANQKVLGVNTKVGLKAFTIIQTAEGIRLNDGIPYRPPLSNLIQRCKTNEIVFHGTNYGTLEKDCSKELEEETGGTTVK